MVVITLPDGSQRRFEAPVTVADVAASIGAGLAKAALAGKVDGRLVDTSYTIDADATLAIVTDRDPEGLEIIRHSTAHLLAYAVKSLFPDAQVTIGPVIDNGFYYDFSYKRPFTPEDLAAIEAKMTELAKRNEPVLREVRERDEAVKFFESIGEKYKAEIIASIPADQPITLYREGDFVDLCRGPHVPSTGRLKVFKLMKLAGAYWRGDSNNEMLQRIYGTAWARKEDQDAYLHMLEEAEKRDHRRLGARARPVSHAGRGARPGVLASEGLGAVAAGRAVHAQRLPDNGYQEVKGPQILDRSLWERSGHWENYRENMFTTESENRHYALKPMNCPGHVQIFKTGLRSLPRPAAALRRVRPVPSQRAFRGAARHHAGARFHPGRRPRVLHRGRRSSTSAWPSPRSCRRCIAISASTTSSTRWPPGPTSASAPTRSGTTPSAALIESLRRAGCEFAISPGEGAFYGPKIEYTLKDAIGRQWQLRHDAGRFQHGRCGWAPSTSMRTTPARCRSCCTGRSSARFERFIGMLLENHAGAMPDVAGAGTGGRAERSPTRRPNTRPCVANTLKKTRV